MTEKYIVALDQGTSGCRAFAVDRQGRICAQYAQPFAPRRNGPGMSEYTAETLLQVQQEVLHRVLDQIGPSAAAALAVCSQRSTVVLWDKTTGRSVAPVLTWEDGRSLEQSERAAISQQAVHQQTGLFKTPFFSAPKIAWCLEHIAQARQAARNGTLCAAPVASFLIWQLTRGHTFATDPTLAQRTLLWDIRTGRWSEPLAQAFGVPLESLPLLKPTAADYGSYRYRGVSIPVCVCTADQQAAAAYQGLEAGRTGINYGTGAFVLHHTGHQLVVLPGLLSSVAVSSEEQDRSFLLEGPVFSAGSVLQWLKAKGMLTELSLADSLCARAQAPVRLLPALGGLGAPYWDYSVSLTTEQVTDKTAAADWVAGALQGIALRIADIIYYLRANGQPVAGPVRVSGGLCRSSYLLAFESDVLQTQLEVQEETENTVLGAALLAARYLRWDTAPWTRPPVRTFSPRLSAVQSAALYGRWVQFVQTVRHRK